MDAPGGSQLVQEPVLAAPHSSDGGDGVSSSWQEHAGQEGAAAEGARAAPTHKSFYLDLRWHWPSARLSFGRHPLVYPY